jgi:hypothetical protein
MKSAHRVSWELHRGLIPDGLYVLHQCDTPLCVNPNHLFLGTQSDNIKDAFVKGRKTSPRNSGEGHPMSKLTNEDVRRIREMGGTTTQQELARRFKVHQSNISNILLGKRWSHIEAHE